jgi:diacylglycerol kinase
MLRTQHNAWIHLVATIMAVAVGLFLQIDIDDWRWIVAAIGMVWAAEAFNTAIESICDLVSPEHNILVKRAKDIGAGAVLFSAAAALLIGVLTFWRYL